MRQVLHIFIANCLRFAHNDFIYELHVGGIAKSIGIAFIAYFDSDYAFGTSNRE